MLSQEKLNNIHKLESSEVLQIFHECVEYLDLVSIPEAEKILCISKRRIYQKINNLNSISIGEHKFPCINLIIK